MHQPPPITAAQQRVLQSLAAGKSVTAAASDVGIDPHTVHRWRKESEAFKLAWEEMLATLWENTKAGLKALGAEALTVLLNVMQSVTASDKDKLDAAKTVLGNLHKVVTEDELRKRVEELISKMEAHDGRTPVN